MSESPYPVEELHPDYDDGTMPGNVEDLALNIIGRKIVSARREKLNRRTYSNEQSLILTLDNGKQVILEDSNDCCAYTELEDFFLDPASVDHVILGVGTTGDFTTWHIYADMGDVMRLNVGWSAGNPFYYGYGFWISVSEEEVNA